MVSDKIPALLTFFDEIALHVTRPIRWDSDHVVLFDDETREIAREIVRCGGLDGRVHIALDYFDASINRISAWVTGYRNLQKALLFALLQPNALLKRLQDEGGLYPADGGAGAAQDHASGRGVGRVLPPLRQAGGRGMVPPGCWNTKRMC